MIFYKSSFNGLKLETKGVYSAYNLTPDELETFRRYFHNQVNGSGSNYTAFDKAERHVWLNLLIHDIWIPVQFDIRSDILKITGSNRIYEKDIRKIDKELKDMRLQLKIVYDYSTPKKYSIFEKDYQELLKLLEGLLKK